MSQRFYVIIHRFKSLSRHILVVMEKIGFVLLMITFCFSCNRTLDESDKPVGQRISKATTQDGSFITWKEHIIDDSKNGPADLSGSDGLAIADLDNDGFIDIVSVHESDTEYDGKLEGYVRVAFGTADPTIWNNVTLASGDEAAAAEDVTINDFNDDGHLDIIVACELAHLVYFQNPITDVQSSSWQKLIPEVTKGRGSFIRVFSADLDNDGSPEIISANKGDQHGAGNTEIEGEIARLKPISYFKLNGDPLNDSSWIEFPMLSVIVPINSHPVDIDNDGDIDVIGGSRGEQRIILFKNQGSDSIMFDIFPIELSNELVVNGQVIDSLADSRTFGFNMDFYDMNEDGLLDIITMDSYNHLIWVEQPRNSNDHWKRHYIGNLWPDQLVSVLVADINSDGRVDIMTGGYSRGSRTDDRQIKITDKLGRISWFENHGNVQKGWTRHDISRRKRGMFDKFISIDLDKDGDLDFITTRGNSFPYDGVIWLEQIRSTDANQVFQRARTRDSPEMPLVKNL